MSAFRLTAVAKQDLKAIGRYTQLTWGKEQRNIYLAKVDAALQLLASEPERGRACDNIREGYRKSRVGKHIVFYLQKSKYVEIVRILHSQMDLEAHFNDDLIE